MNDKIMPDGIPVLIPDSVDQVVNLLVNMLEKRNSFLRGGPEYIHHLYEIFSLDPDALRSRVQQAKAVADALTEENRRLRTALEFYAYKKNYLYLDNRDETDVELDYGRIARSALTAKVSK